jgi:recombination protein RecA
LINSDALKTMAQLNKKFGAGTLVLGGDISHDLVPRFTTGSITFDYALGGGLPGNQWNEYVGESSAGKTGVALKTIAANQAINPDFTTVWIAAEEWVPQYADLTGVDSSRVIVVETTVMEEAYEAAIQFAESKAVDAIIIDSLPALSPSPEIDKAMDEHTMGRGALLTNKFFRKVGTSMKRSLLEAERPVLGIVINQYRQQIGVMHGDPRTTPGGKGKDYAFFTRTEVKRDEWLEIGPSGNKTRIGQSIRARTIKNKTAPPQRNAFFDYYFAAGGPVPAGSYDTGKEIAAMALILDVVKQAGGWINYNGRKWHGIREFVEDLREDIDLAGEITKMVMTSDLKVLSA